MKLSNTDYLMLVVAFLVGYCFKDITGMNLVEGMVDLEDEVEGGWVSGMKCIPKGSSSEVRYAGEAGVCSQETGPLNPSQTCCPGSSCKRQVVNTCVPNPDVAVVEAEDEVAEESGGGSEDCDKEALKEIDELAEEDPKYLYQIYCETQAGYEQLPDNCTHINIKHMKKHLKKYSKIKFDDDWHEYCGIPP